MKVTVNLPKHAKSLAFVSTNPEGTSPALYFEIPNPVVPYNNNMILVVKINEDFYRVPYYGNIINENIYVPMDEELRLAYEGNPDATIVLYYFYDMSLFRNTLNEDQIIERIEFGVPGSAGVID